MGGPRRPLPNLLAMGLIVATILVAVFSLTPKEKLLMTSKNDSPRVSFFGSRSSSTGLNAVAEIAYEDPESKKWPYLSVSIFDRNGTLLYKSGRYAAWFKVNLCWDEDERLWIASSDTGTDVIAATPDGWRRHRWMAGPDAKTPRAKTMIDVESGERLRVVNWPPPHPIRAGRVQDTP